MGTIQIYQVDKYIKQHDTLQSTQTFSPLHFKIQIIMKEDLFFDCVNVEM